MYECCLFWQSFEVCLATDILPLRCLPLEQLICVTDNWVGEKRPLPAGVRPLLWSKTQVWAELCSAASEPVLRWKSQLTCRRQRRSAWMSFVIYYYIKSINWAFSVILPYPVLLMYRQFILVKHSWCGFRMLRGAATSDLNSWEVLCGLAASSDIW